MTAVTVAGRRLPVAVAPARGCNCAVCPWFVDNPDGIAAICSGSNTDCSYCGCARTEGAATSGACGQCSIRCGSRVDIDAWMADVGDTLTFDDIYLDGQMWPARMPRFVPQVETTNLAGLDAHLAWPAYAIGLRRVLSPATGRLLPSWTDTTARAALGLAGDQLSVLVGYGFDPLVESFWSRRHTLALEVAGHDWDLVLTPNFSAYGNFPRAEQLLNFRRNLLLAETLLDAGVNAVPTIYSFRLEDLVRYETWLGEVRPAAVAVNLQTIRQDGDWEQLLLPGLTYLGMVTGELGIRVVVTGSSRPQRIAVLTELFGDRFTLVSQNAISYARRGAVMTAEGRNDVHAHVADAFAANVAFYAAQVEG